MERIILLIPRNPEFNFLVISVLYGVTFIVDFSPHMGKRKRRRKGRRAKELQLKKKNLGINISGDF